jgi:hypothetical protein
MCHGSLMPTTLKSDFDEFLFASIGDDSSGAPVSMLTALARLDVDAWEEAATLSRMPRESAAQRLAALLASLPNSPAATESASVATRLVALLHRRSAAPPARAAATVPPSDPPTNVEKPNPAIYYFIGVLTISALIFFVVWRWASAGPQRSMAPVPVLLLDI